MQALWPHGFRSVFSLARTPVLLDFQTRLCRLRSITCVFYEIASRRCTSQSELLVRSSTIYGSIVKEHCLFTESSKPDDHQKPDVEKVDVGLEDSKEKATEGQGDGGSDGDGPRSPEERLEVLPFPAIRSYQETFIALSVPWRNIFARTKLATLNVAFPGAFSSTDFNSGVADGFRLVHTALCNGDHHLLSDVLGEGLYSKVCKPSGGGNDAERDLGVPAVYELHQVRFIGLLSAWPNALAEGSTLLSIKVFLHADEDAVVETQDQPELIRYRQSRVHIWTFERLLVDDNDQNEDWYVVDMDKLVWPPDNFPPLKKE